MKKQRRTYPREKYLEKRAALHALVQQAQAIELNPEEHNLSGKTAVPILYLDGREGATFHELSRQHFDCWEIKLINPTQPAIAVHFTIRHKYQIERRPPIDRIQAYLAELMETTDEHLTAHPQDEEAQQKLRLFRNMYRNPSAYEVAISNYFRFYRYPYVRYRYADGKGFSTVNTHLIASYLMTQDDEPQDDDTFPRYNVLFVDVEAIARPRSANDHARTANYLNAFPFRFNVGKRDLFIKGNKD